MSRRRWALPTLLVALAGLVVGAWIVVDDDAVITARSARLAAADRTVVYTVTPTFGPSFRLGGAAETVLLVVHLQLPPAPYTPGRSYRFAVIATLRGPDGALLGRWTVSRRTRQTKAERGPDGWAYEAAFVPDGRFEVTDGAAIELALPPAPPRSRLDLRLSEETGTLDADERGLVDAFAEPRALVRVYREAVVDDAEAAAQALGDDPGARRLATYLPWHALDQARRRRSVGAGWERLVAEGRTGEDYEAQGIYVAAVRPSDRPPTLEPAIEVGAGQPAVLHLQGPTVVTVRARRAGPGAGATAPAIAVAGRWLGPLEPAAVERSERRRRDRVDPTGTSGHVLSNLSLQAESSDDLEPAVDAVEGARLELAADGGWRELRVAVPAGWTSLEVTSDAARAELQVLSDAPDRHVGADRHAVHRRADGRPLIPVDVRTTTHYVVGPAASPVEVDLGGPADIYAQVLRIDARSVGALEPVALHVEFIDAAGRVVGAVDDEVRPAAPAPYERLRPIAGRGGPAIDALLGRAGDRLDDDPAAALEEADDAGPDDALPTSTVDTAIGDDATASALGFPLGVAPVSEPASLRLIAPAGAVRARVRAASPALVAIRGLLPPGDDPIEGAEWTWPYDQVLEDSSRWRYAPRRRPRWFPLAADDHRQRVDAGGVMAVHGQIRQEAAAAGEGRRSGPWEALHPRGRHPRRAILERVPADERADALERWGPGSYAALPRRGAVAFDLRASPWPATLSTEVVGPLAPRIGAAMAVDVGGRPLRWTIRGRRGRLRLPFAGARAPLRWVEGPSDLVVLVDRPPRSQAALYRRRQLHQLGPKGLAVTVDKPSRAAIAVNVVIYWFGAPPRRPSELRVELDHGAPRRQVAAPTTRFTAGARTLTAAPEEELRLLDEDRPGASRAHLVRAVIALGDDVAPGRHTLHIAPISGPPVWLRFFREADPAPRTRVWRWKERPRGSTWRSAMDRESERIGEREGCSLGHVRRDMEASGSVGSLTAGSWVTSSSSPSSTATVGPRGHARSPGRAPGLAPRPGRGAAPRDVDPRPSARPRSARLIAALAAGLACGEATIDDAGPPRAAALAPRADPSMSPSGQVPYDMSVKTGPLGPLEDAAFEVLDRAAARRRIWPTPGPRAYRPPTPARRRALAALIRALLEAGRPRAELDALADAAGFTIEGWEIEGRRLLVALEAPALRGGGGAYLVRVRANAEPPLLRGDTGLARVSAEPPLLRGDPGLARASAEPPALLEAPHALSDLDTGPLALDLLVDGDEWPRAAFVSTLGRRRGVDGERGPADGPADPCHNGDHLLAIATRAALEAAPGLLVIQLHGFAEDDSDDADDDAASSEDSNARASDGELDDLRRRSGEATAPHAPGSLDLEEHPSVSARAGEAPHTHAPGSRDLAEHPAVIVSAGEVPLPRTPGSRDLDAHPSVSVRAGEAPLPRTPGSRDLAEHPAVIVSAGAATPSPRARALRRALVAALDRPIALYPEDTRRLGGLANVQGAAVRAHGRGAEFLHLELARELRRGLREEPATRRRFVAALRSQSTQEGP